MLGEGGKLHWNRLHCLPTRFTTVHTTPDFLFQHPLYGTHRQSDKAAVSTAVKCCIHNLNSGQMKKGLDSHIAIWYIAFCNTEIASAHFSQAGRSPQKQPKTAN